MNNDMRIYPGLFKKVLTNLEKLLFIPLRRSCSFPFISSSTLSPDKGEEEIFPPHNPAEDR